MRSNKRLAVIWMMDEDISVENHFNFMKPWIKKTNGTIHYISDHRSLRIP